MHPHHMNGLAFLGATYTTTEVVHKIVQQKSGRIASMKLRTTNSEQHTDTAFNVRCYK